MVDAMFSTLPVPIPWHAGIRLQQFQITTFISTKKVIHLQYPFRFHKIDVENSSYRARDRCLYESRKCEIQPVGWFMDATAILQRTSTGLETIKTKSVRLTQS